MKSDRTIAAFSLLFAFLQCSLCTHHTGAQALVRKTERIAQEDNIREAVIRFQMNGGPLDSGSRTSLKKGRQDLAATPSPHSDIYFVSVNGKDPSDDFMKRF